MGGEFSSYEQASQDRTRLVRHGALARRFQGRVGLTGVQRRSSAGGCLEGWAHNMQALVVA